MAIVEMANKNYGHVQDYVKQALKHKQTAQIYYMGAWSRFHVNQWANCIEYWKQALLINENHKEAKSFMTLALNEQIKEKQKMNEMSLINQLEDAKKEKLFKEVQKYGIKIGKQLHYLPQDIGASLYIDDFNYLHFPVILLYDEFMQCDFIKDFPMNSTFKEQLAIVLADPAPWDPSHKNKLENVEIYFETNMSELLSSSDTVVSCDKKYKKVDMNSDLLSVLRDEHYVVPQFPIFTIVARDYDQIAKYSS